jgi:putative ATPase
MRRRGRRTILFVDEIHRFNKAQQDGLLPHVEDGTLILIGATTENPSFEVIAPLLSRSRVFVLNLLDEGHIVRLLQRAAADRECGLGASGLRMEEAALRRIAALASGDARQALNILELAAAIALDERAAGRREGPGPVIGEAEVAEAAQRKTLLYDKAGEEHYNLISALHKTLRSSDPDAALYWMGRMLDAGEDPMYILRRLVRFASEDVGMADPQALVVAMACQQAFHFIGLPEGKLAVAQAVVYLATAPKSDALYRGLGEVERAIDERPAEPVPLHLRNAPTRLMKELGYGKGYQHAHQFEDAVVEMEGLPDGLRGRRFYKPTQRGFEEEVGRRMARREDLLAGRIAERVNFPRIPSSEEDPRPTDPAMPGRRARRRKE